MRFDPEFRDRRLAGRGIAPLSRPADPKRKPSLERPSTRSRIVIPLASKPADYVPGSGPPVQPISLLLPGDSTSYIIERLLLPSPGLAPNDFEARLEQDLDDEKEKLEAERKSDLVAPQKKKKRGRPPAHSQIESAVVAEPETAAQAKSRHKKGAMSLSTPKKARLEEFEWLSDEEGSPSRQIAQEQFQSLHGYLPAEDEMSEDTESSLPSEPPQAMRDGLQATTIPTKPKKLLGPSILDSMMKSRKPAKLSSEEWTSTKAQSLPQPTSSAKQTNQTQQELELSSFIPLAHIERPKSQNVVVSEEEGKAVESNPTEAKPKKSRKRPRSEDGTPKPEPQGENDWVVERIEDVEYYEVDGRGLVRYFRVSWEGDWPPDQKKTWEPEENIPANLVRNFFKISKSRRKTLAESGTSKQGNPAKGLSKPKQTGPKNGISKQSTHKQGSSKQSKLIWPGVDRKYRSVSEAFAGDQESPEMMDEGYDGEEDELTGDGQDEFFVVTEGGEDELQSQSLWPTASTLSTALGVFRGFS
ncbi:hypothetical protein TrVFT333_007592 [Trichoderma virens FT-333]|nr:hypothetical protein TrVFT333_007592 [Trichoderma virens FT-333]